MTQLERAIEIIAGGNQTQFAKMVTDAGEFKLSQQLVHVWLAATKKRCSPKFAVTIEKLTDYKVTREQLRPDVFPPTKAAA